MMASRWSEAVGTEVRRGAKNSQEKQTRIYSGITDSHIFTSLSLFCCCSSKTEKIFFFCFTPIINLLFLISYIKKNDQSLCLVLCRIIPILKVNKKKIKLIHL